MESKTRSELESVVDGLVGIVTEYQGRTEREGWKCFTWKVTLRLRGKDLTVPFYCGLGHETKPKNLSVWAAMRFTPQPIPPSAADVISSLANDSSACDQTFEDWCADCGCDSDSRKALATFLECQRLGTEFRRWAGEDFERFRSAEH